MNVLLCVIVAVVCDRHNNAHLTTAGLVLRPTDLAQRANPHGARRDLLMLHRLGCPTFQRHSA